MSKHTQGPWEFLEEKEYNNVPFISIRKKGFILIDDPDADEKNSIAGIWSTKPIDFANARLIAAAPELLEALIHAVEIIENEYPEECFEDLGVPKMRAAITKAKEQ